MAMEMTAVWKERKSKSPFPLSHTALESSQKTASFPHSHSFGDDWRFPFFSNSFNFNFDEKCYLHARYLLLPTCPTTHVGQSLPQPIRVIKGFMYCPNGSAENLIWTV